MERAVNYRCAVNVLHRLIAAQYTVRFVRRVSGGEVVDYIGEGGCRGFLSSCTSVSELKGLKLKT